jgi:hypothetical protein
MEHDEGYEQQGPEPEDEGPIELGADEVENIQADLDDLREMRGVFGEQGVKGVVIACPDCGSNHYYEWELLKDNLEHMLQTGEPRMHEPAFAVREEEYIQWDYGKGYIDALADSGLEPDRRIKATVCPWCETPFGEDFAYCPRCGRSLGPVRLYQELLGRGIEEREARALLVRAGFEPF